MAVEISVRMLVLTCTCAFRLLVRLARLMRDWSSFSASEVRLASVFVSVVLADASVC